MWRGLTGGIPVPFARCEAAPPRYVQHGEPEYLPIQRDPKLKPIRHRPVNPPPSLPVPQPFDYFSCQDDTLLSRKRLCAFVLGLPHPSLRTAVANLLLCGGTKCENVLLPTHVYAHSHFTTPLGNSEFPFNPRQSSSHFAVLQQY